ncbi:hypothetical protein EBZ39_15165 [bacterium]|nr:hypothetical protein [bacterium]
MEELGRTRYTRVFYFLACTQQDMSTSTEKIGAVLFTIVNAVVLIILLTQNALNPTQTSVLKNRDMVLWSSGRILVLKMGAGDNITMSTSVETFSIGVPQEQLDCYDLFIRGRQCMQPMREALPIQSLHVFRTTGPGGGHVLCTHTRHDMVACDRVGGRRIPLHSESAECVSTHPHVRRDARVQRTVHAVVPSGHVLSARLLGALWPVVSHAAQQ